MSCRRALRAGVLASAVVLAASACGSSGGGSDPADSPREAASDTSGSAEVLELSVVPAAAAAKCMVPNATVLATQDTAFEGTVTDVSDGAATLEVDKWYAGDEGAGTVSVATPSERLQDLLVAVDFQEGRTYLVSALDGRVSLCGFTAESTPELEGLYSEAFPDRS